ncbi:MAG TPA: recombinase family protein [Clostridia bacterium]|nr:recombinase family protein [Clostridia bacterium]
MDKIEPYAKSVFAYLRKSRAEENENTEEVLARHKAELTRFATKHRLNIKKWYEEVVSGDSLFVRPRMIELLHDVEDGKCTGVLCMDIDRLGRGNMQEQGLILNTLKDADTVIITPDKVYDLNDEQDETQTEFKTFFARQELKMIKKRLSRGVRMTIEKGGYVSNVPFGYARDYKDKIPTLAPHPEESEYVRMIFNLYIQGDGCQTIAYKLKNMGVKPHRGNEFNRTSIRKIITNPVYIGKIVWGQKKHLRPKAIGEKHRTVYLPKEDWMIYDGLHPAIIDEDIFRKANDMLRSKYHVPYRESDQIVNPLAGLLFCRQCGKAITRRPFKNRKYQTTHMICTTLGCVKSARADYVEEDFLEALRGEYKKLIEQQSEEMKEKRSEQTQILLSGMKVEISRLLKQKERLYDLLEQGVYSIETFTEREMNLLNRINGLSKEIKEAEAAELKRNRRAEILIPQIKNVLQNYWEGTPSDKNNLLKGVVEKAFYFKDKEAGPKDFTIEMELRKDL